MGIVTGIIHTDHKLHPLFFGTVAGGMLWLSQKKMSDYRLRTLLLLSATSGLSYWNTLRHTDYLKKDHYSTLLTPGTTSLVGRVEKVTQKPQSTRVILTILSLKTRNDWQVCNGRLLVFLRPDPATAIFAGDILGARLEIRKIQGPLHQSDFDFSRYWRFQNLFYQSFTKTSDLQLVERPRFSLRRWLQKIQSTAGDKLARAGSSAFGQQIGPAMIIGDKSGLESSQQQLFSRAGAMHLLAVSGMHLGIIFLLIRLMSRVLPSRAKWPAEILLICLYAAASGASPSVLRAAFMLSLYTTARHLKRSIQALQIIALAAFFLLWHDPFLLMQVGFQLSCLAVLGIALFYKGIQKLLQTKWWLLQQSWNLTALSLAAQLGTLPLGIYYFSQIPIYALLSNLLLTPLATAVLFSGLLLTLAPPVRWLLFFPEGAYQSSLFLLEKCTKFIASLPGAADYSLRLELVPLVLIYAGIFSLPYLWKTNKSAVLPLGLMLLSLGIFWQRRKNMQQEYQHSLQLYSHNREVILSWFKGTQARIFLSGDGGIPEFLQKELSLAGIRTTENLPLPVSQEGVLPRTCFAGLCLCTAASSEEVASALVAGTDIVVVRSAFAPPKEFEFPEDRPFPRVVIPMRLSKKLLSQWENFAAVGIHLLYLPEDGDLKINLPEAVTFR